MACLARSRAPSARIFVPDIREPKRTSRDLVLMARIAASLATAGNATRIRHPEQPCGLVRSTCINGIRARCEELHPKVECANFHRAGRGSNSDLCRDSIFISFRTDNWRRAGEAVNLGAQMTHAPTLFTGQPPFFGKLSTPRPTHTSTPKYLTASAPFVWSEGK